MQALEEEQRLIDLLRADELEQSTKLEAQRRREKSEQLRQQMAEANRLQIQLKVCTKSSLNPLCSIPKAVNIAQFRTTILQPVSLLNAVRMTWLVLCASLRHVTLGLFVL